MNETASWRCCGSDITAPAIAGDDPPRRFLARRADPRGLCLPEGETGGRRGRSALRRRRRPRRADRGATHPLVREPQGSLRHPERRRIKAVVLSPETVAKDVQVTDQDLLGAYEQAKSRLQPAGEAQRRGGAAVRRGEGDGAGGPVAGGRGLGAIQAAATKRRRHAGRSDRFHPRPDPLARAGRGRVHRHAGRRRAAGENPRSAGTC